MNIEKSIDISDKLVTAIISTFHDHIKEDDGSIRTDVILSSLGVALSYVFASVSSFIDGEENRRMFIEDVKESFTTVFPKALDLAVKDIDLR